MSAKSALNRPIRVVMFGSGPELNPDAKHFLTKLEEHPEIELLAAFCQAESRSLGAVLDELWKRRGWLALPLFAFWLLNKGLRFIFHPREEITLQRKLHKIENRIHFIPNIHAPQVLAQVKSMEPDLGLIYGSPILKPELFEIPTLGTLGIHHGSLPKYRGNKTTFWMMYNGEKTAGVTIQKVNAGLDTGTIVRTGEVEAYRRAYQTVFHELEALGVELYIQAILDVKRGIADYKPQTGD
ncbi:MAG TPA: formyltransferase family protein, partial [Anaerolineales bacterium]|nr:formyltransferase family protein [Anaerolineales bacterium]